MKSVEIDFVVADSLRALACYEKIFEIQKIEVTNFPKGQNEAVFSIYGTTFHMLDENPDYDLYAPDLTAEKPSSVWFNIMVPNIEEVHDAALKNECTEIQGITALPDYGVSNSMVKDSFGYIWMLHQIHKEVSFEERVALWEEKTQEGNS